MPINTVNAALRKQLEELSKTSGWLTEDAINDMFKTEDSKQKLADLRTTVEAATKKNESAAALWTRLSTLKEVVISLVTKAVGVP
jgi:hypothetical protein